MTSRGSIYRLYGEILYTNKTLSTCHPEFYPPLKKNQEFIKILSAFAIPLSPGPTGHPLPQGERGVFTPTKKNPGK
jgi:hypothetical protein